jgi:holin-like protein
MKGLLTALQLGAILLVFQAIGEGVVRATALPLSGPVAGMILLFVFLCGRGGVSTRLQNTTVGALRHMSMLFIPAGAGLMLYLGLLRDQWQIVIAAVIGGTVCTLAVGAFSLRAFRAFRFSRRPAIAEN